MKYYFAPMEGITDYVLRNVHHSCFPGIDRYYTPFLSPVTSGSAITRKDMQEVSREHNAGVPVVPQLLSSNAEAFVKAAGQLKWLGYDEVNLNLGCPSGTVCAKGRGAGFLAPERRDELRRFLDGIFDGSPLPVSIKTRIGISDPEEFHALLALYAEYPVKELTIHPRVQKAGYRGPALLQYYDEAVQGGQQPVCLSGAGGTAGSLSRHLSGYAAPEALMLGRGLIANPALVRQLQGGASLTAAELQEYHGRLFEATAAHLGSTRSTMFRMKELWGFMILMFDHREKHLKALKKATSVTEYQAAVLRIFRELPLRAEAEELW